jgi:hypothetical protein
LGQTLFFPWVCYGLYGREVSVFIKNVLFSNVQLAFHRKRGHGGVGKKEYRERERGGYFLPLGRVRENSMKQGEKCRRRGENDNFILQ